MRFMGTERWGKWEAADLTGRERGGKQEKEGRRREDRRAEGRVRKRYCYLQGPFPKKKNIVLQPKINPQNTKSSLKV